MNQRSKIPLVRAMNGRGPNQNEAPFADVLYVELDPAFVSQTAEARDIYPDRIEVVEQQLNADPTLMQYCLSIALRSHNTRHGVKA